MRERERGGKGEGGTRDEGAEAGGGRWGRRAGAAASVADLEAGGLGAGISEKWMEKQGGGESQRGGAQQAWGPRDRGGEAVRGPAAARAGATLAGTAEIPSVNSAPAAHRPQSPAGR